uniref:Uncharacterized protein n=1 Tax=Arundo donax TaxID=35708 RepID=A0A0A9ATS7_ARUDO
MIPFLPLLDAFLCYPWNWIFHSNHSMLIMCLVIYAVSILLSYLIINYLMLR